VKLKGQLNVGTSNKKKLVAYSFAETEDLSNYGEALTLTLPAACKGKTVDVRGSQAEVRHGVHRPGVLAGWNRGVGLRAEPPSSCPEWGTRGRATRRYQPMTTYR